jgi:hypothetical protein
MNFFNDEDTLNIHLVNNSIQDTWFATWRGKNTVYHNHNPQMLRIDYICK